MGTPADHSCCGSLRAGDPAVSGSGAGAAASGCSARQAAERLFREESGRILATLIGALGDFDLAGEVMQEAFATALEHWPLEGLPQNPAAWITTTARRKAIDRLRRRRVRRTHETAYEESRSAKDEIAVLESRLDCPLEDDCLRLIFTCCHPALNQAAQVALTLRTLGGLTTPQIARAFLIPPPTLAQRLARAKSKIKQAGIPYRVPPAHLLPERLPAVLAVLYLVFSEGYAASEGDDLIRHELCAEAIRLTRLLAALMPDEPEVLGLLALMLLQDSRRGARVSPAGDVVLLEDQDRTLWDGEQIRAGQEILERALHRRRPGSYQLQAAIAAVHSEARRAADTDWEQIVALYDALMAMHPSAVVALNRAAAVAMLCGAAAGLELVDQIGQRGDLDDYLYYHSTRAELLRRLQRNSEAQEAYRRSQQLAENASQRRFLQQRIALLGA